MFVFACFLFICSPLEAIDHRLPTAIRPVRYDLYIETTFEDKLRPFTFAGKVAILINSVACTKQIILHAKNLKISPNKTCVSPLGKPNRSIPILSQKQNTINDFFTITLRESLQQPHYVVTMEFMGEIREIPHNGYYRSGYVEKGVQKWLSVTQFEPASARAAFPCFDEPSFKAEFAISLAHHRKYLSLSNMPLERTVELGRDWVRDDFQLSHRMSTYLVAYSVNDFSSNEPDKGGVPFRFFVRSSRYDQIEFTREVTPKIFNFFQAYFKYKYVLPKIDFIAVPDFSACAMENWGLVTFREPNLFHDVQRSTEDNKDLIFAILAHEIAHQWFGNLVTMKWWTDLWLNEGFATYMEMEAYQNLMAPRNSKHERVFKAMRKVFRSDALKASHKISVPIHHAGEIREIFDEISYKKGATILRMISLFLGSDVFQTSINNYLTTYAYKNAEQNDLWKVISRFAHINVKTIMDTWTLQPGFPVLTTQRDCSKKTITIRQNKFLLSGPDNGDDSCWWIPLTYTIASEANFLSTTPRDWLSCNTSVVIDQVDCKQWFVVNIQAAGLYKVNYDQGSWQLLINKLNGPNFKMIPELNRAMLVENIMTLARGGYVCYNLAFKLLVYLEKEDGYLPWMAVLGEFKFLDYMYRRSSENRAFKTYVRNILKKIYFKLGGLKYRISENTPYEIKLKTLIVKHACYYEVPLCIDQARRIFRRIRNGENKDGLASPNFMETIYCTGLRFGNKSDWDYLWERYRKSNIPSEKQVMLKALACTSVSAVLRRYVGMFLEEHSHVRVQDGVTIFTAVSKNKKGFPVAADFLNNKMATIVKVHGSNIALIKTFLESIAQQLILETEKNEFLDKYTKNLTGLKYSLARVKETVELNEQWDKRHRKNVNKLINQYKHK